MFSPSLALCQRPSRKLSAGPASGALTPGDVSLSAHRGGFETSLSTPAPSHSPPTQRTRHLIKESGKTDLHPARQKGKGRIKRPRAPLCYPGGWTCRAGRGTHRRSALRGMPRGTARRPSPWQSTLAAEQVHLVGQATARGQLRTLASARASARRARTAAPAPERPGAMVRRGPLPKEAASAGQDAGSASRRAGSAGGLGAGGGVGAEEGRARRSGARGAGGAGRAGRRRQQLHWRGQSCPAAHRSKCPGAGRPLARVPAARAARWVGELE